MKIIRNPPGPAPLHELLLADGQPHVALQGTSRQCRLPCCRRRGGWCRGGRRRRPHVDGNVQVSEVGDPARCRTSWRRPLKVVGLALAPLSNTIARYKFAGPSAQGALEPKLASSFCLCLPSPPWTIGLRRGPPRPLSHLSPTFPLLFPRRWSPAPCFGDTPLTLWPPGLHLKRPPLKRNGRALWFLQPLSSDTLVRSLWSRKGGPTGPQSDSAF